MPPSQAIQILIIEDDPGHVCLIKLMLRRAHVSNALVTIHEGQEALDYLFMDGQYADAQHGLPGLILLDVQLPGLDGAQVLERLKADSRTREIPVMIMSSVESEGEKAPWADLGCEVYLVKPFDSETFFTAVHHLSVEVAMDSASCQATPEVETVTPRPQQQERSW